MSLNIAIISPGIEGELMPREQAMGGAFEGADRLNRQTATWHAPLLSADTEVNRAKKTADGRVRDLTRNDGYIAGAMDTHKDSVVGGLYAVNCQPDWRVLGLDETWAEEFQFIAERKFTLWAESNDNWPDASRRNTLTGLVRMALAQHFSAGEVLATGEWLTGGRRPYKTAIQMIDTDRLSNPNDSSDTRFMRRGIEIDRYGAPIAAHIRSSHPNEQYMGFIDTSWQRVPFAKPWGRQQVIYLADIIRPGQTRAISALVSVLKEMKMTKNFKDVVLQNAVVNATFAAAIESELPKEMLYDQLGGAGDAGLPWVEKYLGALSQYVGNSSNLAIDGVRIPHLFPGTKLTLKPAGQPGGVGTEFEASLLRHVSSSLGLSYEQFSRDYTKTNYSSARASMNETWKYMQAKKKMVTDRFATSVYLLWLEEEINRPDTDLPMPKGKGDFYVGLNKDAYGRCDWIGASRGQIDELKETQAAVLRINSGLSTYERESARLGIDFRDTFDQRAREEKMIKERGLTFQTQTSKPGTMKETDSRAQQQDNANNEDEEE